MHQFRGLGRSREQSGYKTRYHEQQNRKDPGSFHTDHGIERQPFGQWGDYRLGDLVGFAKNNEEDREVLTDVPRHLLEYVVEQEYEPVCVRMSEGIIERENMFLIALQTDYGYGIVLVIPSEDWLSGELYKCIENNLYH